MIPLCIIICANNNQFLGFHSKIQMASSFMIHPKFYTHSLAECYNSMVRTEQIHTNLSICKGISFVEGIRRNNTIKICLRNNKNSCNNPKLVYSLVGVICFQLYRQNCMRCNYNHLCVRIRIYSKYAMNSLRFL